MAKYADRVNIDPSERITATGRALAQRAKDMFEEADLLDDPSERAKIVHAANETLRSALHVDRAEVDKKTATDADKIARARQLANKLAELDA